MSAAVQVRVRRACEECGGTGVAMAPLWAAYYADRQQQRIEAAAMDAASPGEKLNARLIAFHAWWQVRVGSVVSITDGSTTVPVPSEEIPRGDCLDGWVERWMPLAELALVAA